MAKKIFLKLKHLSTEQEYIVASEGARTKLYRTPSYNLLGVNDRVLYRRVIANTALSENVKLFGLGITIKLLETRLNGSFEITNLIATNIPPKAIQGDLFS